MSKENVELIRAVFAGWGSQNLVEAVAGFHPDDPGPDVIALYSADVEVLWSANAPDQREYHGRDGLIRAYKDWLEAFSEYVVEAQDFIEAGDDVIVPQHHRGRGLGSGVEVLQDLVHVYTVRNGQIARIREYDTLAEAQAAVGARLAE